MKVLIGYDDSDCAKAALEDLRNAGLPEQCEILLLTVIENWSLIIEEGEKNGVSEDVEDYPVPDEIKRIRQKAHLVQEKSEEVLQTTADKLKQDFPSWHINTEVAPGFAEWRILEKSREWKPDLIIIGSHGRNLLGRIALGSASLKILTVADCSVRIARNSPARTPDDDSPQRIVIAFDGSADSVLAVEKISQRHWRQDAAVRLVTAVEPVFAETMGMEFDLDKLDESRRLAITKLESAGLHVSTNHQFGDVKKILLEEAENWGADAIFLGAKGHGFIERVLLGSVSYSVAARADCSVEVIRKSNL